MALVSTSAITTDLNVATRAIKTTFPYCVLSRYVVERAQERVIQARDSGETGNVDTHATLCFASSVQRGKGHGDAERLDVRAKIE